MSESTPRRYGLLSAGAVILTLAAGCQAPPMRAVDSADVAVLSVLLPNAIKIVEPFTVLGSAEGDQKQDWIELWLQAQNVLDSPGLMIAGSLRVELNEHLPARGNAKGPRLEHWNVDLVTIQDQRDYWNTVTQMYEFRLGFDPKRVPHADKYVVTVIYQPPIGDRLTDEITLTRNQAQAPQ